MYKCISSFKSSKGKSYSYGDKIYSSDYYSLGYSEKRNFQEESDYGTSSSYNSPLDYDGRSDSSSSSSSSDFDFGGGSFGGAGSGDQY